MTRVRWHRWFGLLLNDLFAGSAFEVELEPDLSIKQQYLDVLILRKHQGTLPEILPEGLEALNTYNLMTYKSHQEPLNAWALQELIGHYVNYRKQISSTSKGLIPESEFQLFAVSVRSPQKLRQEFDLTVVKPGVWHLKWGHKIIKILIPSEMPELSQNALWDIFSHSKTRVEHGLSTYHWNLEQSRSLLNQFSEYYQIKGDLMPYTLDDFTKEYVQDHLHVLSPEEALKHFSPEERLKDLSPEERLRNLSPEDRLKNLSPEACLKPFSLKERLKDFSPEEIRAYLKKQET